MDEKKQIEQLAEDIYMNSPTISLTFSDATYMAEKLYNIGYRRQFEKTDEVKS